MHHRPPVPTLVRFFPTPSYALRAGYPVLPDGSSTRRATRSPGPGSSSWRPWVGNPAVEVVGTDVEGRFRIPLRWSTGSTTLFDAFRASAHGSTTITLPADLGSGLPVIQIS